MLYRKTTTAFSAVILGVMALLGVTAHAQLDLDQAGTTASPIAVVTFSKETLPRLTGMETFYAVRVHSGSQNLLRIDTSLGYPLAAGATYASGAAVMRLDLQNLEFNEQLNVATHVAVIDGDGNAVTAANAPRRLAFGGTGMPGTDMRCPGDTCAIFEIGNGQGTELAANSEIQLSFWNRVLRIHPDGNGQARARFFRSVDAALNPALLGVRKDTGFKRIMDVKSSVTTTISAGTPAVADVAATPRFTNFTPAGTRPLGGISIMLATTHWKADGQMGRVATLDDVRPAGADGGSILITDTTQNLGFGTFTLQSSAECNDTQPAGVTVPAEGDNAGRGTATLFTGARTLCVAPRRSSAMDRMAPNFPIPVTSLTAAVSFAGLPNSAFPAPGMTGPVGSIVRNGATVQISYLTVSDRYNQRIIITNRGMADAEYELSNFYTEDGTEGMAGDTAEGMVPSNSSVVVLTREAVTFTGNRARGSATLAVTAPASTISVATTQVNLSDGSTDTVNYEVMGAGAN